MAPSAGASKPHDLAFSKLAARREKDLAFVAAMLRHRLARESRLRKLIQEVVDAALRGRLADALAVCERRAAETPQ